MLKPVDKWNYNAKYWDDNSGWSLGAPPDSTTEARFGAAATLVEPRIDVRYSAEVGKLTISNSKFKFRMLSFYGSAPLNTLTVYGNFTVTAANYIFVAAGELDLRGRTNVINNTTVYLGYNTPGLPIPKNVGLLSDDQAAGGNLTIGVNAKIVGTFGDLEWSKGKVVNKGGILVDPAAAGDDTANVETLNVHIALLDNKAGTISLSDHHSFSGSADALLTTLVADGFENNAADPLGPKTFDSLSIGDPFGAGALDVVRGGKIVIDGGVLNLNSVRLNGVEFDFNHANGAPSVLHISSRVAFAYTDSLHGVASTDHLAFDQAVTSAALVDVLASGAGTLAHQDLKVSFADGATRTFHLFDTGVTQASFVNSSSNGANFGLVNFG